MPFDGKVALVTGGSSGIGLAIARALAGRGAHVWAVARDQAKLEGALAQFRQAGPAGRHGIVSVDVSKADEAAAAVAAVTEAVGAPDYVFNCAGVAHPGYFQDLDIDIFRWHMEVNYFGTVNVCKAVVPAMIARRSGHITNISSVAGFLGVFGYTAYGASKYAVRGFSDVLRAEMKPLGIRVSVVFPPDCDTPQLAYENQFKPHEAKYITSTSQCLAPSEVARSIVSGVERGRYTILPGMEGKLIYRLTGLIPGAVYPIMDFLIARAQRNGR